MRRMLIGLAAVLTLGAAPAHAGIDKAGTTAASFLSVGSGAEVLGMGGTAIGSGAGLNAAQWNAAALGRLTGTEYQFSHATLNGASPQEWIAAGGKFGPGRTRWGLSALYQGDGVFDGRDASNNPTGSFSASSMAIGGQIAHAFMPGVTTGLGMKYVSERLGTVNGGGFTFDAGLQVQAGLFGFGAAAQNVFGRMSYSGMLFDFPTNYGLGASARLPLTGLTFALDANFPTSYYTDVRGGFEWRWHDMLALRTGYRAEMGAAEGEPVGGPTFGMGAGANGFWFDYGFLTGGSGGNAQHRVALTYRPSFLNGGLGALTPSAPQPRSKPAAALTPAAPKPMKRAASESKPKVETPAKVATPMKVETPAKTELPEPVAPKVEAPKPAGTLIPVAVVPNQTSIPVAPASSASKASPNQPEAAGTATQAPAPTNVKPNPAPAAPVVEAPAATPAPAAAKPEQPAAEPAKSEPPATAKSEPPATAKSEPPATAKSEPPAAVKSEPAAAPPAPVAKPAVAPRVETPPARPATVKVGAGQSLADIAKQWGTTTAALMNENNMVSEKVKPGRTLKLPPASR